jgi:transaldolase
MKIFVATASLDDVRWAAESGIADGVLTTPMLLSAESAGGDGRDLLSELCRAGNLPVCATVTGVSGGDIYREARDLARVDDRVIVQVPLVEDAPSAIHRLAAEGVRVAVSFVFSAAQAMLAAKAGASMVSTSIDQLDASGLGGVDALSEIRSVLDAYDMECDVMAMEPHNPTQFAACALGGADAVAVRPAALRSFLVHPLTDRGVDQFLNELAKRPRAKVSL